MLVSIASTNPRRQIFSNENTNFLYDWSCAVVQLLRPSTSPTRMDLRSWSPASRESWTMPEKGGGTGREPSSSESLMVRSDR